VPLCGAYQSTNVAIGWKFHITIGQQEVDQHAVVVRGIPDTQLREDIQRTPARRLVPQQRRVSMTSKSGSWFDLF